MAWGVRNGLLDRKEYLPVLLKAWNAMVKDAVHPNGFLGYVQGTGKEPKDGQPVTYKSADLLHEESEARSIQRYLHQKYQRTQQKMDKRSKRQYPER